jgi:hypothetical protein
MNKKFITILVSFLILSTLTIAITPFASAADKNIKGEAEIEVGSPFKKILETGKGFITYSWHIIPDNTNDSIIFIIRDDNGITKDNSTESSKYDQIEVDSGKSTFVWQNNNANGSIFSIFYNITYPEADKEIGTGCYSSSILTTISLIFIAFCAYGYYKRRTY